MVFSAALAEIRPLCVEHLGEHVADQLLAFARPGFGLVENPEGEPPTGQCRFGGAALLEPGTPWPEFEASPLSLFAVLDTDELAPWLGDRLPARPGLLNFFYLHLDDQQLEREEWLAVMGNYPIFDEQVCRVVPADPARAVPVTAPRPATVFPARPVHASPVVTLPDPFEPILNRLDLGPDSEYAFMPGLALNETFAQAWQRHCHADQAFGWPSLLAATPLGIDQDEDTHLLQLASGEAWHWSEGGSLNFVVPTEGLRTGDYSEAVALPNGW